MQKVCRHAAVAGYLSHPVPHSSARHTVAGYLRSSPNGQWSVLAPRRVQTVPARNRAMHRDLSPTEAGQWLPLHSAATSVLPFLSAGAATIPGLYMLPVPAYMPNSSSRASMLSYSFPSSLSEPDFRFSAKIDIYWLTGAKTGYFFALFFIYKAVAGRYKLFHKAALKTY